MTTSEILNRAKSAKGDLFLLSSDIKNRALFSMADSLVASASEILDANREDIAFATGVISDVMIDRLRLDDARIASMADGIREVANLPDPVGRILSETVRPNGLSIQKISCPIGVVAIIYESRPNVTSDAAALALKSGNVCILRGGKEACHSTSAIVKALRRGLSDAGLSSDLLFLIEDISRAGANELMHAEGYVDLLIPRGGKGLIRACVREATVPCVQTGEGICHVYADQSADVDEALKIIENAKASRPSVCNAEEVLLVHQDLAPDLLPRLSKLLRDVRIASGKTPVEFRCDARSLPFMDGIPAGPEDFDTEFLDYILAVKTVNSVQEAVAHISAHSTGHSEAILTRDTASAEYFCAAVDSAAVYVNASTRFTDGGEFGLGCEMGISTQKIHARGPMGLEELTSYKYVVRGSGQIR